MRDTGQFTIGTDIRFDKRQVFLLSFAALASVLIAFFGGVAVGRRLGDREQGRISAPLAKLDRHGVVTRGSPRGRPSATGGSTGPLAFQESLRRKRKLTVLTIPPSRMAKVPKPSRPKIDVPKEDEPVPGERPRTKAPAAAGKAKKKLNSKKADPGPAAKKPSPRLAGGTKAPFPELARPPSKRGNYTLQISARRDARAIFKLRRRLRSAGYRPTVTISRVPGRGRWYRLILGSFGSRRTALRFSRAFRQREALPAVVVGLR